MGLMLYVHFGFLVEKKPFKPLQQKLFTSSRPCPGGPGAQQQPPLPKKYKIRNRKKCTKVELKKKCLDAHLALEGVLVLKHVDELGVVNL